MQEQLDEYFGGLLSRYQCGFRQGYGTQNCLLAMIEKLKKIRYKKGIFSSSPNRFFKSIRLYSS